MFDFEKAEQALHDLRDAVQELDNLVPGDNREGIDNIIHMKMLRNSARRRLQSVIDTIS